MKVDRSNECLIENLDTIHPTRFQWFQSTNKNCHGQINYKNSLCLKIWSATPLECNDTEENSSQTKYGHVEQVEFVLQANGWDEATPSFREDFFSYSSNVFKEKPDEQNGWDNNGHEETVVAQTKTCNISTFFSSGVIDVKVATYNEFQVRTNCKKYDLIEK